MKIQKALLIGVCATASFAGLSVPTIAAAAEVNVFLGSPPPPVRYERVPPPRRGYVWVNGYWDVRGHKHVWHKGRWERARAGYYYVQPTWVERNNRWELQRGSWRRGDQDRDGIPNRYDRDRDGDGIPNRFEGGADRDRDGVPNRYDRDRDGDGVNNRRDDAPDNPRRR